MKAKADIVAAIEAYRARGLTLAEISKRIGLHRSTVCDYIATFKIGKGGQRCPHCGLEIHREPG